MKAASTHQIHNITFFMAFPLNLKNVSLFLAQTVLLSANIIITPAPLKCTIGDTSRMYQGCLRGQECTIDGRSVSLL